LLAAVQVADDPVPAASTLADWLEEREDPRGLVVRLSTEYWPLWRRGEDSDAEHTRWRRLVEDGYPVVKQWLGVRHTDRETVDFQLTTPLLYLSLGPYVAPRPDLRAVLQAGWAWFLHFRGRPDLDFWLSELGPVRELCFEHNQTIRDDDVRWIGRVPSLRWLDLSCPHVTDAGLVHLHGTRTLREVRLRWSGVTRRGVEALRQALPDCKVEA
jgi:hypothetical protein